MWNRESDSDYIARMYLALLVVLLSVMFLAIRSRDLAEKGDIDRRITALEAAQSKEK